MGLFSTIKYLERLSLHNLKCIRALSNRFYLLKTKDLKSICDDLGPVVQSLVSPTTLLRCQHVKYMPTKLSSTLLFFCWKNVGFFCTAKDSLFFQQKNKSVFVIFTFENLRKH